jgi:hypothetical protein
VSVAVGASVFVDVGRSVLVGCGVGVLTKARDKPSPTGSLFRFVAVGTTVPVEVGSGVPEGVFREVSTSVGSDAPAGDVGWASLVGSADEGAGAGVESSPLTGTMIGPFSPLTPSRKFPFQSFQVKRKGSMKPTIAAITSTRATT